MSTIEFLPEELLEAIFQRVTLTATIPADYFENFRLAAHPCDKPPPVVYRPLASVASVCRRWRKISLPLLHEVVVLRRWYQVAALGKSLQNNRNLRPLIRRLHLHLNQNSSEVTYNGPRSDEWQPNSQPKRLLRSLVDDLLRLLQSVKRLEEIETFGLSPRLWHAVTSHIGGAGVGSRRAIRWTLKIFKFFTGTQNSGYAPTGIRRLLAIFHNLEVVHVSYLTTPPPRWRTYPELTNGTFKFKLKLLSIGYLYCDPENVAWLLSFCSGLLSLRIALAREESLEPVLNEEYDGIYDYPPVSSNPALCEVMSASHTSLGKLIDLELGTRAGIFTDWGHPEWDEPACHQLGRLNSHQRQQMETMFEKQAYKSIKYLALGAGICPPPQSLPPRLEHLHLCLPVIFYRNNPDNQIPYSYPTDILNAKNESGGLVLPKLTSIAMEEAVYYKPYELSVLFGDGTTQVLEMYPFERISDAFSSLGCSIRLEGCLAWEPAKRCDYLESIDARDARRDQDYWDRWYEAVSRVTENL